MNGKPKNSKIDLFPTAVLADAVLRAEFPLRLAPPTIKPLKPRAHIAGNARPVRHEGSVDLFLEAINLAQPGDILVIDNQGREDEACVGDLIALEALDAGLQGIIVWGLHRDTHDLLEIDIPVFSQGALPTGPRRLFPQGQDNLDRASIGSVNVTSGDYVVADDDGIIFISQAELPKVLEFAAEIKTTERKIAEKIKSGENLKTQLRFDEYLEKRANDKEYTFRIHVKEVGGAVEE